MIISLMKKRIPSSLNELYATLGKETGWYINLRWRLSHFEEMEQYMPLQARVLDAGCGYGLLANLIALHSEQRYVIGVDSSEKRISLASRSIKNRKNINFLKKNLADVDFTTYDVIAFSDVLHHLSFDNQDSLLSKIYTQMKVGGLLLIKEIDTKPAWKYLVSFILDTILNLGQSICYRSQRQWEAALLGMGFSVSIIPLHKDTFLSSILYVCKK
jgi:2-polyprenyl-3-methyl-5-hydroxy-6-metoxy-1,4-benzoquinol methylase